LYFFIESKFLKEELKKKERYLEFWKCNNCKETISTAFYYIKSCQHKYCEECKEKVMLKIPFNCTCGELVNEEPQQIILREIDKESSDENSSSNSEKSDSENSEKSVTKNEIKK